MPSEPGTKLQIKLWNGPGNDFKFQVVYYHPDFWVIYRIIHQRLINTSIFKRKGVVLYHPHHANPKHITHKSKEEDF